MVWEAESFRYFLSLSQADRGTGTFLLNETGSISPIKLSNTLCNRNLFTGKSCCSAESILLQKHFFSRTANALCRTRGWMAVSGFGWRGLSTLMNRDPNRMGLIQALLLNVSFSRRAKETATLGRGAAHWEVFFEIMRFKARFICRQVFYWSIFP